MQKGRSHTSLHGYLLCLLKHLRVRGTPLADADCARLMQKYHELAKRFPATIVRAAPVTSAELQALATYLAPYAARGFAYAVQMLALLAVGVRGKLRAGAELLKVPWDAFGVSDDGAHLTVWLQLRKANKTTRSSEDLITLPSSGAFGDPLLNMRRLAALRGRTLRQRQPPPAPRSPLLPAFTPIYANGRPCPWAPGRWLTHELRRLYAIVGLPPPPALMRIAGHGLRRGGAVDELDAGVLPSRVRKGGGWASEKGMRPYDARGAQLARHVTQQLRTAR